MTLIGYPSPERESELPGSISTYALAADVEELVSRFAEECKLGLVTQRTADELKALIGRADRLCRSSQALLASAPTEQLLA